MQVIVIEPDDRYYNEIQEALLAIDPELWVFRYRNAVGFHDAIQQLNKIEDKDNDEEKKSLCLPEIAAIVADFSVTKIIDIELWKKIIKFIRNRCDPESEPLKLVFTTFADSEHKIDFEKFYDPIIFNVLIKPFDKLLLQQYLDITLNFKGRIEAKNIYTHTTQATVEIIKDISLDRLTELGFRTYSSREIPLGKIARYYGDVFAGPTGNSVFAYCYKNTSVPGKKDLFYSSFSYFGIAKEQLAKIRQYIQSRKDKSLIPFAEDSGVNKYQAVVLTMNEEIGLNAKNILESKFSNLEVLHIPSLSVLSRLLPSSKKTSDADLQLLFGTLEPVKIVLDKNFSFVLEAQENESEKPLSILFSEKFEDLKNRPDFISSVLTEDGKSVFASIKRSGKVEKPHILKINLGGHEEDLYIKVLSLKTSYKKVASDTAHSLLLQQCSAEEVAGILQQKFKNLKAIKMIFVDTATTPIDSLGSLKQIVESINQSAKVQPKFFAISSKNIKDYDQMELYSEFDDVFVLPLEHFYLSRKIKMHINDLTMKSSEDSSRHSVHLEAGIKTAHRVTPKTISEVHISFLHSRSLQVGKMRNIVLWVPNEPNMPEITTMCRFCEEQDKGEHVCEFLFFGVHDHELKYIRKWMKETYADEKQKSS